ncbi:MAG: ectonucleotide pyrophosphatase/phosphodiesterase [Xanthomonadales bacterium]|nr:ectonucleotide pyrophosphatase/phosphodiesterase [Xanthomonadales bacterium]
MQPQAVERFARGTGGYNAAFQQNKPYLILISIDGFRWDYMDRYSTPNMDRIAISGSKAERLLPVFPTLTFPNHYSIATGLYPEHHGIVANDFPDPARNLWYSLKDREMVEDRQFYAGEPIWVTAESQGMVAASFFFVGTEAPIKGVSPTHWRSYDKKISGQERVDQVLNWLQASEQSRPHIYTLYFEDVDDHSHWYGPDSEENTGAIGRVDSYIGRLLDGLEQLPYADQVNIILLSDHGQGAYLENQQAYLLADHVDLADTHIVEGGSYLFLHLDVDEPGPTIERTAERAAEIVATVNNTWKYGRAYLPEDTPVQWHVENNPRFPDVILMPEAGYAVLSSEAKTHKINKGDHGWAPETPAMHGFFVACGPNIKPGVSLGAVNNIDVYPLMLSILGLEAPDFMDGDTRQLADTLYTTRRVQSCSKR